MKENPLQYRVRGTPVPTTQTRGTNYPKSTTESGVLRKLAFQRMLVLGERSNELFEAILASVLNILISLQRSKAGYILQILKVIA